MLLPEFDHSHQSSLLIDDTMEIAFHDPPSSPFLEQISHDDQENIAPDLALSPMESMVDIGQQEPHFAIKASPEKKFGLKERVNSIKASPTNALTTEFEEAATKTSSSCRTSSMNDSPLKQLTLEQPGSNRSNRSHTHEPLSKSSRILSAEPTQQKLHLECEAPKTPLRDNEGLTVAIKHMENMHTESRSLRNDSETELDMDNTDYNFDGPDITSVDIDDTCFSAFSEMPGLDMAKFASLKQSPTKNGLLDATPRARPHMTPSTVRRTERTPSPTRRRRYKENDTTSLLLDFTAQMESFSTSHRISPALERTSPSKYATQPDLRSYYQAQRSASKGAPYIPATPSQSRQVFNLLDFELPPPPTPRSLPTVTIRELESVKSQFQSQVSSLTASLSGKEAEVSSLANAVADAERRVGQAQETVRDETSAREHAEAQMAEWKKKGEEVQKLLQDVQAELARNDLEREQLLARLAEAEKRSEDAESRVSDLETKVIEAESKTVDMTAFANAQEVDNKKIYSELECQAAVAEKMNEVGRELHTAYKAKHEKKIKALKDSYHKKAEERCKELCLEIARLERQLEQVEKEQRDNASHKTLDGATDSAKDDDEKYGKDANVMPLVSTSNTEDMQKLETQRAEIENLKAKVVGLQSELQSLRESHDALLEDLEVERIEKGELVAAAEQMLAMCGEKMGEMQQEDLRRSQNGSVLPSTLQKRNQLPETATHDADPQANGSSASCSGSTFASGCSNSGASDRLGVMNERNGGGIAKPSGLRAPGGFGFQSSASSINRGSSAGKSRLLSNIERMGGGRTHG